MASVKRWLVGEPVSPQRLAQIRAQLAAAQQQGAAVVIVTRRGAIGATAAVIGGTMTGDGLIPPLNAPPAGAPVPGVQPGTSSPVVLAQFVIIYGPANGLFEYGGPPALGNLEASVTQASQDPLKNTTYPGIASYDPNGTAEASSIVQLDSGQLNLGAGFQFAGTGGASPAALTVTAAPSSGSAAQLNSGEDATGGDAPAAITVQSADATGGSSAVGTVAVNVPVLLGDTTPPPASNKITALYADVNSIPRALNANDSNVYAVGHLTLLASAVPQTINSTSAETITGCTFNAESGASYKFKVILQFEGNGAAGNPSFQIAGAASVSYQFGNAVIWDSSTGANRLDASTNSLTFQGPVMSTNIWYVTIDGYATFSGSGSIGLRAFTSVAADTFKILNAVFEVTPV
jgi:hypothetical protein